MQNKKNAIMIADTRSGLIGNLLVQIKETNADLFDEALIYYEEITEEDKKIMEKIMPCKFVKYDYDFPASIKNLSSFSKFSKLMFARYDMFRLLNEYSTITWIDTDVLIVGDLSSAIENAKIHGMVANFEDKENKSYRCTDTIATCFSNPKKIPYDLTKYNMSSGFIVVSDTLPLRDEYTNWCYDKTVEYAELLNLPDQAILNIFTQEFKIDVYPSGENGAYCVYPYRGRDTSKAKIIHSWGSRKFWNNWYLNLEYPLWNEYYNKWLSLGGSSFLKEEIRPAVSVVIPIYKPNFEYLKQSVDSIAHDQIDEHGFDFDNIEIILVCEPFNIDEIKEFVQNYNDPRIKLVINEERYGIAKSLNIGIKTALGKYIARMDDDDISREHRLYLQYTYLERNTKCNLVTCNYEYFGDFNEKRISLSGRMAKAWSIFTCPFDHPTIMFNKEYFVSNDLLYDENRKFVEDWELWCRAFDKGLVIGSINRILFRHRWHNSNASSNNQSQVMMRELIKKNFKRLNVDIDDSDLTYIGPWNGYCNAEELFKMQEYFEEALENNEEIRYYNQRCLKRVFDMRIKEAKTGALSDLIIKKAEHKNSLTFLIKKLFFPLYKPFKNKMTEISTDNNESLIERIEFLEDEIDDLREEIKEKSK